VFSDQPLEQLTLAGSVGGVVLAQTQLRRRACFAQNLRQAHAVRAALKAEQPRRPAITLSRKQPHSPAPLAHKPLRVQLKNG
jgi:hypothetical protein